VLDSIERRFPGNRNKVALRERIVKVGYALLAPRKSNTSARPTVPSRTTVGLCDEILVPWSMNACRKRDGNVVGRVKLLRKAILPELVDGNLTEVSVPALAAAQQP